MKIASIILIWLSIGLGVLVAYTERHHKKIPEDPAAGLAVALAWPALVAADLYRAWAPPKSDNCTVGSDG